MLRKNYKKTAWHFRPSFKNGYVQFAIFIFTTIESTRSPKSQARNFPGTPGSVRHSQPWMPWPKERWPICPGKSEVESTGLAQSRNSSNTMQHAPGNFKRCIHLRKFNMDLVESQQRSTKHHNFESWSFWRGWSTVEPHQKVEPLQDVPSVY